MRRRFKRYIERVKQAAAFAADVIHFLKRGARFRQAREMAGRISP